MTSLAVGLAAIAITVTLLNLLLSFAVIRRLRSIQEQLSQAGAPGAPAVGTTVAGYTVDTVDGGTLTLDDLDGDSLVVFFSPGCQPCKELIARFAAEPPPARTYAFIAGSDVDPETQQYATDLAGVVARIAYVDPDGPVPAAFGGVAAFPTLLRINDRTVTASGHTLDDVRTPELTPA